MDNRIYGLIRALSRRGILIYVMTLGLALCPLRLAAQSVTLAWSPSPSANVAGYMLYSNTDGTNFQSLLDAGTNTLCTVTGLEPGSTNYFEVVAYDTNDDESPPSNQIEYTVPNTSQTLVVQTSPTGAGSVTGGGSFAAGTPVTVTAAANDGYTFANWTVDGIVQSMSPSYSFTLATNITLVANFTANPVTYTVATQVNPASAGSVTGGGDFAAGTVVTVTAAANGGYTFTNWTVNVIVQSASANYSFTLATNITLVACFAATVAATNAATNAVTYTVTASAGQNGTISPSGSQIIAAGANLTFAATPGNGYQVTQWLVNGAMAQAGGTTCLLQKITANTTVAVAFSAIPTVTTNGVAPATTNANTNFTLLISGNGTLTPSRTVKALQAGKRYTLTAVAAKGSVFAGWTSNGILVASVPKYTFLVESNVMLQASFIPNPFISVAGNYHGLFYVTNDAAEESSGSFVATVTKAGAYSARLRLGAGSFSLSGAFSVTGAASKSIPRRGLTPVTVDLQLGLTNGPLTGTISDGAWTADLVADVAVYSKTNPAPQAGKYTLLIPGSENASTQPGGNGFGAVIVSETGNVTFSGTLGDGTPVSSTSIISSEGQWPLYVSLYAGNGSILGWLNFTNDGAISGQTGWFKLPEASAKLYPGGFTNSSEAMGSVYQYTNGLPLLGFTQGQLVLTNGDLSTGLVDPVGLGPEIETTSQSAANQAAATLAFKNSTGQFKGSVMNPATGKPIAVNGVVLQNQNLGAGCFLGANESGSVILSPAQ
ncbi:MAG: fibronectin type III domain-containing protein [Limisphaerales bacterium]